MRMSFSINYINILQMEDSFGIIMLAIVDEEPKVLNLKEMLTCYLNHQKEIITRRHNLI